MIGRLNHVAIAVPDLAAASAVYRDTLGASVSAPLPLPEHGVTTVFVTLPNTKIELIAPLGDASPIASFLAKNAGGGMHHMCFEVPDIRAARDRLVASGARILGDGEPRAGAHGKPVIFLSPRDFCGTLIELEEIGVSWFIGIAAYVVIWWIVIFAVLPFGIHPAAEGELGHDAGAPAHPRLKLKVAITTAIAAVLWLGFYWAVEHGVVNFRGP